MSKLIPWLAAFVIVSLDQATKWYIESTMPLYSEKPIISGFFSLVHIQNKGMAFSLLSDLDSTWVSPALGLMAVIAVVVIILIYRSTPSNEFIARTAFIFIGGGAVGNLVDRVRLGAVTDFLLFYIDDLYWPAFNVADSAITIGVLLLAITFLFRKEPETSAESE